ncbi:Uncharacterised protein [Vibrio cholerae]|nr:Uncharacterised protein [Vibrio cholerae]
MVKGFCYRLCLIQGGRLRCIGAQAIPRHFEQVCSPQQMQHIERQRVHRNQQHIWPWDQQQRQYRGEINR